MKETPPLVKEVLRCTKIHNPPHRSTQGDQSRSTHVNRFDPHAPNQWKYLIFAISICSLACGDKCFSPCFHCPCSSILLWSLSMSLILVCHKWWISSLGWRAEFKLLPELVNSDQRTEIWKINEIFYLIISHCVTWSLHSSGRFIAPSMPSNPVDKNHTSLISQYSLERVWLTTRCRRPRTIVFK